MAELPLLTSEIMWHAKLHCFDTDLFFFYRAMTELDEEYMLYVMERHKKEQDSNKVQKPQS